MTAFVTIDDYETALQRNLDGTEAAAAEFALEAACEQIRQYLNQTVDVVENDVVTFDGHGTISLVLPELPVLAVNEVTVNDEVVTDYYESAGVLYRRCLWACGWQNISVDYDHGYAHEQASDGSWVEDIPADIKRAAIALTKFEHEGINISRNLASETIGPFSYTLATGPEAEGQRSAILSTIDKRIVKRRPVT